MEAIEALASRGCRIATAHDAVHNDECCFTFHSPYTTSKGIVINLQTFVGTIDELAVKDISDSALFVRIVKQRVRRRQPDSNDTEKKEPDNAPTKLAIGVEGGFQLDQDKYDTLSTHSVVVMKKKDGNDGGVEIVTELPYTDDTKSSFPMMVSQSVDSIVNHVGVAIQQDVQAWQHDETIPISKYANERLPFVENGVTISPDPSNWKCEKSGATENLWLNLSDGFIGGGRKHWDGSGGSNGALDHYIETGKLYPLVVKLGTITADLTTADCYSYAHDEDGPVQIPNLKELLHKRGIHVANLQKTVKSTAELEVELNANYAFDAITEAGSELVPLSGPSLQGLQNLGNSCYMNAVLQALLGGTVPELAKRYGTNANDSVTKHPLLQATTATQAPTDLLCQTTKLACALTSGVFARQPLDKNNENDDSATTDPKYRLAPRMFKHVIGKDHVDFKTSHQQDAAQFLQYLLERLDRAELAAATNALTKAAIIKGAGRTAAADDDNNDQQPIIFTSSHLFSFQTTDRLVCTADQKIKYKTGAAETIWSLRIPMEKAVVVDKEILSEGGGGSQDDDDDAMVVPDQKRQKAEPVPTISFDTCVEEWAKQIAVEGMNWSHMKNKDGSNKKATALQQTRFSNFPPYLLVQMQRYQLGPDWTPIKLEVNLDIPQEINLQPYKSTGPQPDEVLVPEEKDNDTAATAAPAAAAKAGPVLDETALSMLMDMGFSLNSCKRALTAVGGSDVEAATSWVFEHNMDPDFNDPLPEETGAAAGAPASSISSGGVDEGVVQSLVDNLGCFTAHQVRAALKTSGGAADRAADWLFSHMDDLDSAIAALEIQQQANAAATSTTTTSTTTTTTANAPPLEDGAGDYTLVGMISHIGKNTGSGHYVAHLKKAENQWVIFNDEKVAVSSQPPFEHAYLYLFQRKDHVVNNNNKY